MTEIEINKNEESSSEENNVLNLAVKVVILIVVTVIVKIVMQNLSTKFQNSQDLQNSSNSMTEENENFPETSKT